ncbi:rhodanese-like domain-containing protein [Rapidithrix thailandica]|uniref:Rhodanese-like domain-containing protein n=1 Tax=Rapidithrix thailandica TaxID=413964 RepID=A0AAW9SHN4_9BACT
MKQALQAQRKIRIIDVRNNEEFAKAHIPSALNIELPELKDRKERLDKGYQYVTVCNKGGGRSAEGARFLKELGYDASWLCGGTDKWMDS